MVGSTTAAILGGSAIVGKWFGARQAAKASKKAARIQSEAADRIAAESRAERDRYSEAFLPFRSAATGAVNTLASRLLPAGYAGTRSTPMPAARQAQPRPAGGMGGTPMIPQIMPPQIAALQGGMQAAPGQASGPPGLVRVQAPTGQVALLPAAEAMRAKERGATILDGAVGAA